MKSRTAIIRRKPSDADLAALIAAARATVLEIAKMDGAIGTDAIERLYVTRLYETIVKREVRQRR